MKAVVFAVVGWSFLAVGCGSGSGGQSDAGSDTHIASSKVPDSYLAAVTCADATCDEAKVAAFLKALPTKVDAADALPSCSQKYLVTPIELGSGRAGKSEQVTMYSWQIPVAQKLARCNGMRLQITPI